MCHLYRKSNWCHGACPLYRGFLSFKESINGGSTVVVFVVG